MITDEIEILKQRLDKEIEENCSYERILKTSEENNSEQFMKQEIPHTVQIGKNSILGKGMIKLERWENREWKVE